MLETQRTETIWQSARRTFLTKRNLSIFGSFALGCILTGYYFSKDPVPPEQVPLIKSDATPYKVRPENEEQPRVPHEDKLVYNRLAPRSGAPKVERLLPGPEQPILIESVPESMEKKEEVSPLILDDSHVYNRDEMFPLPATAETVQPTVDQSSKPVVKVIKTKPKRKSVESLPLLPPAPAKKPKRREPSNSKKTARATTAIIPAYRPLPPSPKQSSLTPKQKKKIVPPTKRVRIGSSQKKIVPPQKIRYRLQFAAMRTPTLARQEWHRLIRLNPQLKKMTPQFARIDLGARKGIFYRVQGGRFPSQAQAQRLCRQLKLKTPQISCMVVSID